MIRISCTNCKTVLSIDDAFAGGVCRCQHCGTIQTVPAQARGEALHVGPGGQSVGGTKSLYQGDARAGSGSGLDELAGVVASSGLASSRLTHSAGPNQPAVATSGEERPARRNLMPFVIVGAVLVALLLVIIVILLSRNPAMTQQVAGPSVNPVVAADTPSFCGAPLSGTTVIYLLDCGGSSGDYLGDLKDAAIKSIASLGPDRKFEILFWNNGSDGAYPQNTTTYASKENIASAQKAIDEVAPFGQSDVKAAMQLAIAQHPDAIVLATGKGWDLDNAWLDNVMAVRGSAPVKIHTFSLGPNGESAAMKKLASQTGGSYHEISQADLRTFGQ